MWKESIRCVFRIKRQQSNFSGGFWTGLNFFCNNTSCRIKPKRTDQGPLKHSKFWMLSSTRILAICVRATSYEPGNRDSFCCLFIWQISARSTGMKSWIIKRVDWKLVITWGVSGSLIGWYFGQDGRNIVEICDVKKWRKNSKIIRISCPTWVLTDRFNTFLFASCNVFFIFGFTAISTRPSHAWIFKVTTWCCCLL